jgi:hypothetical protein
VSYPGEEAVYQATVEEAQAVEVRRKHAGAEEYSRAEDEGVSAREEGEGEYGGWDFPPILRLYLVKHL